MADVKSTPLQLRPRIPRGVPQSSPHLEEPEHFPTEAPLELYHTCPISNLVHALFETVVVAWGVGSLYLSFPICAV
ncbi:hypothetical protein VNO78_20456 [Psophocarpus tetragonolobus]|uniref:Uncharacterized protein n=1 Tax=Psophocarpus tetragonolobus TaxID=3891 RepID=A0AAN9SBF9_PSOTE